MMFNRKTLLVVLIFILGGGMFVSLVLNKEGLERFKTYPINVKLCDGNYSIPRNFFHAWRWHAGEILDTNRGYVRLSVLLPALEPMNSKNQKFFNISDELEITLWNACSVSNEAREDSFLRERLSSSAFGGYAQPIEIKPYFFKYSSLKEKNGTDIWVYRNTDQKIIFVLECSKTPNPRCTSSRVNEGFVLRYWYNAKYLDRAIELDQKILEMIKSFSPVSAQK